MKAIRILEPIDRKYPDHPGVTHYLIHSYDFAPLAKHGVAAANKYAKLAPAAPHAQHMPSHIYSMLGMWEASIASNVSSVAVAEDYAAKNKLDGTRSPACRTRTTSWRTRICSSARTPKRRRSSTKRPRSTR